MPNNYSNDNNSHYLDELEAQEQEEIKAKKKAEKKEKYNIFNRPYTESEGVSKDEVQIHDNPNLKNFFVMLKRKISVFLQANLLFIFGNFPIFFLLAVSSGYLSIHTTQPVYMMYPALKGAMMFHNSAATSVLWSQFSRQAEVTVLSTIDYIFLGIGALLIITFGLVRVGVTYILRNSFRGEGVFLMHDFFYAIKRNLRQGIIYGILDILIIALIVYDIMFFSMNYGLSMMMSIMFFMSICFAFIYFLMRHYIYLMLITFDLSIPKMIKNAFLFTMIGFKRNVMLILGTIVLLLLEYFLLILYVPLGVLVPFVILPSLFIVMGIYAAYPKIKQIMIDPYYEKSSETAE